MKYTILIFSPFELTPWVNECIGKYEMFWFLPSDLLASTYVTLAQDTFTL